MNVIERASIHLLALFLWRVASDVLEAVAVDSLGLFCQLPFRPCVAA